MESCGGGQWELERGIFETTKKQWAQFHHRELGGMGPKDEGDQSESLGPLLELKWLSRTKGGGGGSESIKEFQ